jgi:hypothetical protein
MLSKSEEQRKILLSDIELVWGILGNTSLSPEDFDVLKELQTTNLELVS